MIANKVAILTFGLCLAPAVAFAQQSPAREALKRACTSDYMEHCSAFAPGGPEVEACFRANMTKLSPDCATAIVAYKRERKQASRYSEAR